MFYQEVRPIDLTLLGSVLPAWSRSWRLPVTARMRPGRRASEMFTEDEWQEIIRRLRLRKREAEVARAIYVGKSQAAIAAELKLSIHTIREYVRRIYRRLGINSQPLLIVCVLEAYAPILNAREQALLKAKPRRKRAGQ